uniref:Uncharacterized protein n=1 Tax=Myripristis murdjan TaxID=586833 RepID=A0A667YHS2_9TELE
LLYNINKSLLQVAMLPGVLIHQCNILFFHSDIDWQRATSIYDFSANDIDGNVVSLDKYRGNVVIITNVASK